MATVYKVEITSHWKAYHPDILQRIIKDALKEDGNEFSVDVEYKPRPKK